MLEVSVGVVAFGYMAYPLRQLQLSDHMKHGRFFTVDGLRYLLSSNAIRGRDVFVGVFVFHHNNEIAAYESFIRESRELILSWNSTSKISHIQRHDNLDTMRELYGKDEVIDADFIAETYKPTAAEIEVMQLKQGQKTADGKSANWTKWGYNKTSALDEFNADMTNEHDDRLAKKHITIDNRLNGIVRGRNRHGGSVANSPPVNDGRGNGRVEEGEEGEEGEEPRNARRVRSAERSAERPMHNQRSAERPMQRKQRSAERPMQRNQRSAERPMHNQRSAERPMHNQRSAERASGSAQRSARRFEELTETNHDDAVQRSARRFEELMESPSRTAQPTSRMQCNYEGNGRKRDRREPVADEGRRSDFGNARNGERIKTRFELEEFDKEDDRIEDNMRERERKERREEGREEGREERREEEREEGSDEEREEGREEGSDEEREEGRGCKRQPTSSPESDQRKHKKTHKQ